MKALLFAIIRHAPMPYRRLGTPTTPQSSGIELLASSIVGLLIGALSAAIFLAASLVLPARVALLLGLLAGLAASIPRPMLSPWSQPMSAWSMFALGAMLLAKLEILSEVDLEWIPVTLMCSSAFARASVNAVRRYPIMQMSPAHGAVRLACLAIGVAPLAMFGIWPEPVWGLWVAAAVTLVYAGALKGKGWSSPIVLRWIAAETVYALCVLLLMSAAAITGIQIDDSQDF